MRKILCQKFWSLGTTLGSLGPGSQGDVRPRACKCQIQVIWGPCEPSVLVALQGQAENPKTAGAWCDDVTLKMCKWMTTGPREHIASGQRLGRMK